MKNVILGTTLALFLGTSGFAFAEMGDGTGAFQQRLDDKKDKMEERRENKSSQPQIVLDATQMACIKTAIGKREDTLIAGHDAYALAIKNAYTARKTALMAAWDQTDRTARRNAVKVADKAFRDAVRTARMTWNTARRTAWKTFETDRKACAPTAQVSSTETGTSQNDASL